MASFFVFLRDRLQIRKDEKVIAVGRPEPVNAAAYSRDTATIFHDIGQINAPYFICVSRQRNNGNVHVSKTASTDMDN